MFNFIVDFSIMVVSEAFKEKACIWHNLKWPNFTYSNQNLKVFNAAAQNDLWGALRRAPARPSCTFVGDKNTWWSWNSALTLSVDYTQWCHPWWVLPYFSIVRWWWICDQKICYCGSRGKHSSCKPFGNGPNVKCSNITDQAPAKVGGNWEAYTALSIYTEGVKIHNMNQIYEPEREIHFLQWCLVFD